MTSVDGIINPNIQNFKIQQTEWLFPNDLQIFALDIVRMHFNLTKIGGNYFMHQFADSEFACLAVNDLWFRASRLQLCFEMNPMAAERKG